MAALCHDRQLKLCCLSLDRNSFFGFLKTLDVATNSVFGHRPRFVEVASFGYKARKGRDGYSVPAVFVGLKESRVNLRLTLCFWHAPSMTPRPNARKQRATLAL